MSMRSLLAGLEKDVCGYWGSPGTRRAVDEQRKEGLPVLDSEMVRSFCTLRERCLEHSLSSGE